MGRYEPDMPPALLDVEVDDRERSQSLLATLASMPEVTVTRRRMEVGDYRWGGCLLVERKTLDDLLASIFEQRFFRQIHRLRQAAEAPCLVIEGTADPAQRERYRPAVIQGALIHATLVQGIPILRSRHPRESAWLMMRATVQLANAGRISRPALRGGTARNAKRRLQHYLLEGIPGLGSERNERLLDRFGSIERIATASESELGEIAGIGPTTAKRIRWIVSEARCIYRAEGDILAS